MSHLIHSDPDFVFGKVCPQLDTVVWLSLQGAYLKGERPTCTVDLL